MVQYRLSSRDSPEESSTKEMLNKLGLSFEPACLEFEKNPASSATASTLQVREKIHTRSLNKWKHFSNELAPLKQFLEKAGIKPASITKVLMSHLHFDHAGGMVYEKQGSTYLSFPNATYYIQQEELNFALTHATQSYRLAPLEFLRRSDALFLLDGNGTIDGYIDYEITGGHCPFHQVFKVHTGNEIYFFGGDVLPEAMQVVRRLIAKYGLSGK